MFKKSDTEFATWTVDSVRLEDQKVGDSKRIYQLKMADGNLYNDGEWVAQNRLLDPQ